LLERLHRKRCGNTEIPHFRSARSEGTPAPDSPIIHQAPRCHYPQSGSAPRRDSGGARLPQLIYFHEVDKGGHFAAWEEPELFAAEIRAAVRSLR
jgi:pimeloyl-ACP methyl ester carboxylesterase